MYQKFKFLQPCNLPQRWDSVDSPVATGLNQRKKVNKEMESAKTEEWKKLAASMRKTLAENLDTALQVAGEDPREIGSTFKKMNLTDLSIKTKIARSTISKLQNEKTSNGIQANPDLNTICRLAAVLNLPPAFLLMSSDDWKRLLGALNGLAEAISSPYLDKSTFDAADSGASVGLNLAKKIGLYADNARFPINEDEASVRQLEINQDIDHANAMKLRAILTTTAVTHSFAKNYDDMVILTAIGAIFGATFKPL